MEWDWKLLAYVMEEEVTTICIQKSFAQVVLTRNKSDSKSGSTVFAIIPSFYLLLPWSRKNISIEMKCAAFQFKIEYTHLSLPFLRFHLK